ncbi:MAG: hypothetical protein K2J64_07710, partial [Desulfovibrio sp.]|nr:hypothetical protein [Desulfovibrio sp.]
NTRPAAKRSVAIFFISSFLPEKVAETGPFPMPYKFLPHPGQAAGALARAELLGSSQVDVNVF